MSCFKFSPVLYLVAVLMRWKILEAAENSSSDFFLVDLNYTLSEAWSGVNWVDLMAAGAPLGPIFMTGLYSVLSIVPNIVLVDLS